MRVLTTNDEWVEVNPGTQFCGVGFKEVVITAKDNPGDERFIQWFQDCVVTRFDPPGRSS